MRRFLLAAALAAFAALLTGCGQIGPLYQPPPEPAESSGA